VSRKRGVSEKKNENDQKQAEKKSQKGGKRTRFVATQVSGKVMECEGLERGVEKKETH